MIDGHTANQARLTRATWRRLVQTVQAFARSEVRAYAFGWLATLFTLLFVISGLNVVNSYVGRDFMTAIERRDQAGVASWAVLYVGVFAASTVAAVILRFAEERSGLLWRAWLTRRIVDFYLNDRTYLRLSEAGTLSNPDQRITEDVRTFVQMTLSLFLMFLNGALTVLAFSGVLWSISRPLFVIGLLYAAAGSLLTFWLGRPLIALNYQQADREADFRTTLIEVRENAECVALHRRERQLAQRLHDRLDALVRNMRSIIGVNRNLGFFTTGYNYMIQIIPALVVAPLFIRGEAEFGVITQSAMAFSQLLGAFSLVVTQFQVISSYGAVLARLSALGAAVEAPGPVSGIETAIDEDRVAYESLTLMGPAAEELVRDLSFTIAQGARILVCSKDPELRGALVRATAGVWDHGRGRVRRPELEEIVFLPERPYLPPGTLREMMGAGDGSVPVDEEIRSALGVLGERGLFERTVEAQTEQDWERVLTLHEQQMLSVARVLVSHPKFAFVDDLGRIVGAERLPAVLNAFIERGITCIALGAMDEPRGDYDAVLELADGGAWRVESVRFDDEAPLAGGGSTPGGAA
ncbi:MAG: ABC transporter ATP-binding protein/permease [Deltaproteobacteria bacterium]|nr:ABC transporter ATP-binding protein/permease [Deltaproteobacteria bacterium]